jgi:hypothetical protein
MSLTYTTFKTSMANLLAISESDPNFVQILPEVIEYTELRIQRDLDLVASITYGQGNPTTIGTRIYAVPSEFQVLQEIRLDTGDDIINLTPQSKEYMNAMYTSKTITGTPVDFAVLDISNYDGATVGQIEVILGPTPDDTYPVEVVGTYRVTPLSDTNESNYLSNQMSDLYTCAAMVFLSGWIRNFGSQADQPQMAQSWESQYQTLLKSATTEEFRRKFQASAWSSMSPATVATPTR